MDFFVLIFGMVFVVFILYGIGQMIEDEKRNPTKIEMSNTTKWLLIFVIILYIILFSWSYYDFYRQ